MAMIQRARNPNECILPWHTLSGPGTKHDSKASMLTKACDATLFSKIAGEIEMIRLGSLVVPFFCLLATSVEATPPTPQPPLELRLAKMKVIVVGLLNVDGEGQGRKVTLKVSQVLKCPTDLKGLKPETELTVTPRPVGFSDQGGKGVWSLDIQRKGDHLHVSKYEFITYGRNFEEINKKLGGRTADQQQAINVVTEVVRKTSIKAKVNSIRSKNIHLPDWKIEHPFKGYRFFCAILGYTPAFPMRKFAAVDPKGNVVYPFGIDEFKGILSTIDRSGWTNDDYQNASILYVHLTTVANEDGWLVLRKPKDFLDIKFNMPTKGPAAEARQKAAEKIKAPVVEKPKSRKSSISVSFYAWHLIGGQLKRWQVLFPEKGVVSAIETKLGRFGGGGYD